MSDNGRYLTLKGTVMRFHLDRDLNKLIGEYVRKGWTYRQGRHGKLRTPDGRYFVTIACTPSDHRSLLNIRRDLRRVAAASSDRRI